MRRWVCEVEGKAQGKAEARAVEVEEEDMTLEGGGYRGKSSGDAGISGGDRHRQQERGWRRQRKEKNRK